VLVLEEPAEKRAYWGGGGGEVGENSEPVDWDTEVV